MEARRRQNLVTVGRWLYALAAAVATYLLLAGAVPAAQRMLTERWPYDGTVDWLGARALIAGINPYTPEGLRAIGLEKQGFGHPPTTPFWFLPLATLDNHMMAIVVAQLMLLLLILHLGIVLRELRVPMLLATLPLLFAATLSASWMQDHLRLAQVSEAIAFAYVLAWYFLRRGDDAAAGALLGLACTLKLFPGVLVLLLALSRRWRGVFAAAVAYLLIAATMTVGYGASAWPLFFRLQRGIADQYVSDVHNGSLNGIVLRLFAPACHGPAPTRPLATALATVTGLLLLALAWRLSRRALGDPRRIDLPFALFSILSYFVNPWSWEHYNVLLILPLLLLAVTFARGRAAGLPRWAIAGGLAATAAATALLGLDMVRREVLWRTLPQDPSLHWRLHAYEVGNWLPAVIVMALLALLLRRDCAAAGDAAGGDRGARQFVAGEAVSSSVQ